MTLRERTNLIEHKIQMLKACNWECEVCGNPLTLDGCQLAHRLPSTKYNLKTYGKQIIHHPKNLACVCSLKCNSAVLLNRSTHPVEANELIDEIRDDLLCS
jgi:hypothetical protein